MPELGMRFFDRGAARTVRLLSGVLLAEIEKGNLVIPDVELAAAQFVELATAGLFRRRLFGKVTTLPTEAEITRNANSATAMFLGFYAA
jgi:TetR/AcrR family transcriptional regulator of autoinduction and epiphytic fitness